MEIMVIESYPAQKVCLSATPMTQAKTPLSTISSAPVVRCTKGGKTVEAVLVPLRIDRRTQKRIIASSV